MPRTLVAILKRERDRILTSLNFINNTDGWGYFYAPLHNRKVIFRNEVFINKPTTTSPKLCNKMANNASIRIEDSFLVANEKFQTESLINIINVKQLEQESTHSLFRIHKRSNHGSRYFSYYKPDLVIQIIVFALSPLWIIALMMFLDILNGPSEISLIIVVY